MEILVNDEKLDFTLEKERTLGEVIIAVEAWLSKSNLVIASLQLVHKGAEEEIDLTDDIEGNWPSTPLEDIERLVIKARLLQELQLTNIETVMIYLDMLKSAIEKRDISTLDDLLPGQENTFKSLKIIFPSSLKPESLHEASDLESLLAGADAKTILEWPDGVTKKALNILESLVEMLSVRRDELTNPFDVLATSIAELEHTSEELKEASVLLQTGQEQKAMATIVRFADISQRILRIISGLDESSQISLIGIQIKGDSASSFFSDFNRILRELLGAFDAKDMVLIGDLLEYEVTPRLELLLGFLREVQRNQSETP